MTAWISRFAREVFRREALPARLRWWLAAEGMASWFALLRDDLGPHLGGRDRAAALLAELAAPMFQRRHAGLLPSVAVVQRPDAERGSVGLVMGALYRPASNPGVAWVFAPVGGSPRGFADHRRAEQLLSGVSVEARWREVTHHLGELMIAMTEGLPAHLPRARVLLGDICHAAGVRHGAKMKKAFDLPDGPDSAMLVLRMAEQLYRVNPDHWGETDAGSRTGYLEGTACPWYTAAGWTGAHCGIFGQFQAGVSEVFGLRYTLGKTIPKHGGDTCRIDLKPIPLGRSRSPSTVAAAAPAPESGRR